MCGLRKTAQSPSRGARRTMAAAREPACLREGPRGVRLTHYCRSESDLRLPADPPAQLGEAGAQRRGRQLTQVERRVEPVQHGALEAAEGVALVAPGEEVRQPPGRKQTRDGIAARRAATPLSRPLASRLTLSAIQAQHDVEELTDAAKEECRRLRDENERLRSAGTSSIRHNDRAEHSMTGGGMNQQGADYIYHLAVGSHGLAQQLVQLDEERRLTDKNATRVKELEESIEAVEHRLGWMKDRRAA